MNRNTKNTWIARSAALSLGLILASGGALVTATPAIAVSSSVAAHASSTILLEPTPQDPQGSQNAEQELPEQELPEPAAPLAAGTVTLSGEPVVGSTLTVTTSGWPEGTALSYEWFWNGGNMGSEIESVTGTSYTVAGDVVTRKIGVIVTGTLDGFEPTTVTSNMTAAVTAPQQTKKPAPVASSDDLPAYLTSAGATPQPQTSAGLPEGALNPGTAQTANVAWHGADSFVDVYVYSTPVFVGTFPVVNGVAQITLSSSVLSTLATGQHTLVISGQSSGAVEAVSVTLAAVLASTGTDLTAPITVAVLLLLLGGAMLVARRQRRLGAVAQ